MNHKSLGKIRIGRGSQYHVTYYTRVNDTEQTKVLQTEDVEFLFQFKTAQFPLFQ